MDKKKLKTYGFWMSLTGAVIVVLKTLGEVFSFPVDDKVIISIVSSVCGVFVVLGLIEKEPANEKTQEEIDDNTLENIKEEEPKI